MYSNSAIFEFVPAAHAVSDWRFRPFKSGTTPDEESGGGGFGRARNHPPYIDQHERKKRKLNAQPGAILRIVTTLERSAGPEYEVKPSPPHLPGSSFFRVPLTDRGVGECVTARIALEAARQRERQQQQQQQQQQQPQRKTVAIFSSPLERAIQTAILATPFEDLRRCGFAITLLPQLQECVRRPCDVVTSRRIIREQVEIASRLHAAILESEGRHADADELRAAGGVTIDFGRMGWRYEREHGRGTGTADGASFGGRARRPCEVVVETADMVLNRAWALRRFLATGAYEGAKDGSSARVLLYTHAAMIPLLTGLDSPAPGCLVPLEMAMDRESGAKTGKYALVRAVDTSGTGGTTKAAESVGIRPAALAATGSAATKRMASADARGAELARAAPRREAIVLINEREAEGYEPRLARAKRDFIHAMGRTAYVRQPEKQAKVARAARRERQRQKDSGQQPSGELEPPADEDYFPTCCASDVWNAEAAAEGYRATFKKDVNTEDWPVERELREKDAW